MLSGAGQSRDALDKVEDAFRWAAFLVQHGVDDLADSGLVKPRLLRKALRSSSSRATMVSRAALMPWMNPAGDESANLRRAGAPHG